MEDACYVSEHSEVNAQQKKMTLKSKNVSGPNLSREKKQLHIKPRDTHSHLLYSLYLVLQLTFSGVAQLEEHMEYVPHPTDPNK